MVNNLDWTAPLSAIDFLRDVGKHFRVNRMLAKEAVAARLESEDGISFTEFSYQILQGMDYLELYRRYGCILQTGGSDQWGNLTAGVDLVHRVEGASVHALATPLITKADGTKFGKTESGTVWLDPALTSPYAFYQFWLNADDRDVVGYLKVFSLPVPGPRSRSWRSPSPMRPPPGRPSGRWPRSSPRWCTATSETARAVAASRALFGQGELADARPGDPAGRPGRSGPGARSRRRPCRAWPSCWRDRAWSPRGRPAGGRSPRGGIPQQRRA